MGEKLPSVEKDNCSGNKHIEGSTEAFKTEFTEKVALKSKVPSNQSVSIWTFLEL